MFDAVRFWLDMGVDGYRLDAIGTIFEDEALPDHQASMSLEELLARSYQARTPEEYQKLAPVWEEIFHHQHDLPGVHDLMKELRALVDEYDDRVLVGETDEVAFYGSGDDELHMVFNFPLTQTERLTPAWVRENQKNRLALIPSISWPCNTLGNHDSPRMYNRFGDGANNDALARQNLLLMLTLKGTPFLYNGEEIGMTDTFQIKLDQVRDQLGLNYYRLAKAIGALPEEEAVKLAVQFSRDKNRTPMQWANAANAGFSPAGISPWLPVNPNYAQGVNVEDQDKDPGSLLHFYRRALRMRRQNPALIAGDYAPVDAESQAVLAYTRAIPGQRCLVIVNMTAETADCDFLLPAKEASLVFSTHDRPAGKIDLADLALAPFEGLVAELL